MSRYKVAWVSYDAELFDPTPLMRTRMEETLSTVGAVLQVEQCYTGQDVLTIAADADLVMCQTRTLLTRQVMAALPKCRGIITLTVGYNLIDVAAATDLGIPVGNVVGWCNDEVAEHALTLLLASARLLRPLDRLVRADEWPRAAAAPIHRIRGKTLGIVAFGRLARAVAERATSFGMTLLAYDPYIAPETMAHYGVQKVELDELLRRADFITVHAPLTEETFHLLGARRFALMKEGVFIVNTSRGPVIDEAALIAALRAGKVRGAGLDVMEQEPLPPDSPLREFDNVILTPHVASFSVEALAELYQLGAEIAVNLLTGKWVQTIVNPDVRAKAEERWGVYK